MPDYDPRLVELYDIDNPDGPDHDFYRALAAEKAASSILDLGCGTGILTVTLAGEEREVVGVDPSANMLDFARRRRGAEAVTWLLGDSRSVPATKFDYALMSGNVAQHIPEADWHRTLQDLRKALVAGGTIAFESRNPRANVWTSWSSHERTVRDTRHGRLVECMEVDEIAPGVVKLTAHNHFIDQNELVTETQTLYFRDADTIASDLAAAGFKTEAIFGDWSREPFTQDVPLMIFLASA